MIRALAAFPVLLALAACQSPLPPEQIAMTKGARDSQTCATRLERRSDYIGLAPFIPLAGERATEEQLKNQAIPGLPERVMLRAWRKDLARCRLLTLNAVSVFAPYAVATLQSNYLKSDQIIDELIAGRTTWSVANKKRDAIGIMSERRLWQERRTARVDQVSPSRSVLDSSRRGGAEGEPVSLSPSRRGTNL